VAERMPDVGFYLAIAQWHLGNHDEARKHYDRTVKWHQTSHAIDNEFHERRLEARELMAIEKKK
jgi:hypothetical protein